jgi:hypothetical protein
VGAGGVVGIGLLEEGGARGRFGCAAGEYQYSTRVPFSPAIDRFTDCRISTGNIDLKEAQRNQNEKDGQFNIRIERGNQKWDINFEKSNTDVYRLINHIPMNRFIIWIGTYDVRIIRGKSTRYFSREGKSALNKRC